MKLSEIKRYIDSGEWILAEGSIKCLDRLSKEKIVIDKDETIGIALVLIKKTPKLREELGTTPEEFRKVTHIYTFGDGHYCVGAFFSSNVTIKFIKERLKNYKMLGFIAQERFEYYINRYKMLGLLR
jgi:hypothetical protein